MRRIRFAYYAARTWREDRFQPNAYFADAAEVPFAVARDDGEALWCAMKGRDAAALHLRWPVPSFGEVTLPTAALPPREAAYNLNVELAAQRLRLADAFAARWGTEGYRPGAEVTTGLARAREALCAVEAAEDERTRARWGDLSLSLSMPAAEAMALECAAWQMARRKAAGDLAGFLLGCNFFGYPGEDTRYEEAFSRLFNYATLPFYWASYEPTPGDERQARIDRQIGYLRARSIPMKGHPLMWYHSLPGYVPRDDLSEMKRLLAARIEGILARYGGEVDRWDVINEMQHVHPFEDARDAIDLTRFACECVGRCAPRAVRVVNVDEPFGEYMAHGGQGHLHPVQYFEALEAQGVPFEVIGIQVYHGSGWTYARDLFEMSRYLDRYARFGKPVHLTELGVPSREGRDPRDYSHGHRGEIFPEGMRFLPSDAGFWHAPWSERTQADWVEGFYRVLMGKPFVEAITWWDLTDANGHFFPHSGLLDEDMRPKEAYARLLALRRAYIDT